MSDCKCGSYFISPMEIFMAKSLGQGRVLLPDENSFTEDSARV